MSIAIYIIEAIAIFICVVAVAAALIGAGVVDPRRGLRL